jgi:hypothetical protein
MKGFQAGIPIKTLNGQIQRNGGQLNDQREFQAQVDHRVQARLKPGRAHCLRPVRGIDRGSHAEEAANNTSLSWPTSIFMKKGAEAPFHCGQWIRGQGLRQHHLPVA